MVVTNEMFRKNWTCYIIAPSDRLSIGRNGRKQDKNQTNWMRIEEVVQIVIIIATTAFIVVTMTQDWQSRLDVVTTMVATMTPYF